MPSRFSRAGCWARALSGQTIGDAATPPANAMNSRRRIENPIEVTALGHPWTLLPFANDVRLGSKADMTALISDVRLAPDSDQKSDIASCPLRAIPRPIVVTVSMDSSSESWEP